MRGRRRASFFLMGTAGMAGPGCVLAHLEHTMCVRSCGRWVWWACRDCREHHEHRQPLRSGRCREHRWAAGTAQSLNTQHGCGMERGQTDGVRWCAALLNCLHGVSGRGDAALMILVLRSGQRADELLRMHSLSRYGHAFKKEKPPIRKRRGVGVHAGRPIRWPPGCRAEWSGLREPRPPDQLPTAFRSGRRCHRRRRGCRSRRRTHRRSGRRGRRCCRTRR